MPTRRPIATPRGTERRVKRHSSLLRIRPAKGRIQRCSASSSRLGAFFASHRPNRSTMVAHQAGLLPLPVLLFFMLALVVGLAPFGQRQFDLRAAAAVEIDGKGHERHALAGDGAMQLRDLALMKEQLRSEEHTSDRQSLMRNSY